jgi:predicted lipoprotein with Yx(FWY)xxD motif
VNCTSSPGGIVVETDGSGGAPNDAMPDGREAGGGGAGGSGGMSGTGGGGDVDSSTDVIADMTEDRGDGALPPLCVFHTDPPPVTLAQEGGTADVSDAESPDVFEAGIEAGVDASTVDAGDQDVMTSDVPPMIDASTVDTVADISGDRSGGRDGGGGGGGGDAGPAPSVTVLMSPFLGPYLADSAGRTLYTFGNDRPGDCHVDPLPDCEADCLIAWPAFDAGKRTLAPSLDPQVFGSTTRTDGMGQITTYYGWPLYYYRSDMASGQINGHGKSKTWHVATVIPNNIMIMRDKTNPRYIADGNGNTLYVFDQDTPGTAGADPVSRCTGACLTMYPPFERNRINAVSSLDPNDLSLFVRPDTQRQQVAYKGAPLYLSSADMRSGDQKGIAMGWTVAAAP